MSHSHSHSQLTSNYCPDTRNFETELFKVLFAFSLGLANSNKNTVNTWKKFPLQIYCCCPVLFQSFTCFICTHGCKPIVFSKLFFGPFDASGCKNVVLPDVDCGIKGVDERNAILARFFGFTNSLSVSKRFFFSTIGRILFLEGNANDFLLEKFDMLAELSNARCHWMIFKGAMSSQRSVAVKYFNLGRQVERGYTTR